MYIPNHVFHPMTDSRYREILALDNFVLPSPNGRKQGFSMYMSSHIFHPMPYDKNLKTSLSFYDFEPFFLAKFTIFGKIYFYCDF